MARHVRRTFNIVLTSGEGSQGGPGGYLPHMDFLIFLSVKPYDTTLDSRNCTPREVESINTRYGSKAARHNENDMLAAADRRGAG
eukprot:scaffold46115_cov66-Phaeocystis_antarctica.AAC.6